MRLIQIWFSGRRVIQMYLWKIKINYLLSLWQSSVAWFLCLSKTFWQPKTTSNTEYILSYNSEESSSDLCMRLFIVSISAFLWINSSCFEMKYQWDHCSATSFKHDCAFLITTTTMPKKLRHISLSNIPWVIITQ